VRTHWKDQEQKQHQAFSTEPEGDSLTPYQARGLLTRARIKAPFDTIDNVKAKIDNVKAKIQDEEDQRPLSRPSLARRHILDQLGTSLTSSLLEGPLSTSIRLARQDARSHEQFLPPTKAWSMPRGATSRHKCLHHDVWGTDYPHHASTLAGGQCGQLAPVGALIQPCSAAQPSPHHHLQPCSTQAPSEALKHPLRRAQAYG
jgi:hypothetical protein